MVVAAAAAVVVVAPRCGTIALHVGRFYANSTFLQSLIIAIITAVHGEVPGCPRCYWVIVYAAGWERCGF